jgi:hypothetical protein
MPKFLAVYEVPCDEHWYKNCGIKLVVGAGVVSNDIKSESCYHN